MHVGPLKKIQCNQLKIPLTFFLKTLKFGVVALCCFCMLLLPLSHSLSLSLTHFLSVSLSLSHGFDVFVCVHLLNHCSWGSLLITSTTSSSTSAQHPGHLDLTRVRASLRHDVLQFDVAMNQLLPMKHLAFLPRNHFRTIHGIG